MLAILHVWEDYKKTSEAVAGKKNEGPNFEGVEEIVSLFPNRKAGRPLEKPKKGQSLKKIGNHGTKFLRKISKVKKVGMKS